MTRLTDIWRYPVKAHGAEALETVTLKPGAALPWDRIWAVAHEAAKLEEDGWLRCRNFNRGAASPQLMAITATLGEERGEVSLTHPEAGSITVAPDTAEGAAQLIAWSAALTPENRAQPVSVYRSGDTSLTDSNWPSISIGSHASRRAFEQRIGQPLHPLRFRINLWIDDDLAPDEDLHWIGKTLRIGEAELAIEERIERCKATTVNPETGQVDADTLGTLERDYGHLDFGLKARVLTGGKIRIGDKVTL